MTVTQDAVGRRVVLSPQEALVAGGRRRVRAARAGAVRDGSRISSSISGRCRRSTAVGSGRWCGPHVGPAAGRSFRIACPCPAVRTILEVSSSIMCSRSTTRSMPKRRIALGSRLVRARRRRLVRRWSGSLRWPLMGNPDVESVPGGPDMSGTALLTQPFLALVKLVAAAAIGVLVTPCTRRAPPIGRPDGPCSTRRSCSAWPAR